MAKYILSHDLGTSGNKVTLFTTEGELVRSETYVYNTKWFNDNWAEQDAELWYKAFCETTKKILADVNPEHVLGVSFSGQMMGCLCVDSLGKPLHNSIIWADMRASIEETFINDKINSEEFYKITGHRASASYTLAKFLWIKNNLPEIYNNTYKVLNAKDYILHKLTGEFVTDYSDASGTNLLDINTLKWSEKIAKAVDINIDKFPELRKSTDIIGLINSQNSIETGLAIGTPIICGGGDGAMSALGAKCINTGDVFCTLGTSSWNATTTNEPFFDKQMRTFNFVHIIPGKYIPCGTMQTAGASLSWLKKEMAIDNYEDINNAVKKSKPGSNGLYFMPYLMGERSPRWNSKARGCFIGLKMQTTSGDMFRSVYEGVAFNLEIIFGLISRNQDVKEIIMTGGGAKSEVWNQIIADIYNTNILIPNYTEEATSIGAAITAGVGLGIFKSFDKITDFIKIDKTVQPIKANVIKYNKMKPIFESIYQSLIPVYNNIDELQRGENE
ncbi:MAG: xylulokinase [Spirochaetaceae bacterium]